MEWVRGISADVDDMYEKKQFNAPGKQFLTFMTAMYLGIRGFMDSGVYNAAGPLVQAVGIGTSEGAQITSTRRLPWSLKCIWAMISDVQPIAHYKKRWYMLIATVAGSFAIFQLGTRSYEDLGGADKKGTLALVMLLLVNICGSVDDCLTQGQYTKVLKVKGSSILVFRSTLMSAAGLTVSLFAGLLNDNGTYGPQYLALTALPWAILACIPIATNMMADERVEAVCSTDTALLRVNKGIFSLAWAMGITVVINIAFAIVPVLKPYRVSRMLVTNFLMVGVLTLSFFTVDRRIAKINVYLYLCRLCTFGMGYPLQQFYTTDPSICPDQNLNLPNFSFVIYSTFGGIASYSAVFLGLYLFENYLVHWNAQKAFWVTTAFQVVAGMFDIMNTTRFNQTLLGWTGLGNWNIDVRVNMFDKGDGYRTVRADDMVSFLFGSALIEPLIDQLDSLPSTLLLSKLCPKGIETTMFAILAGFSNIGLSLSGQLGGYTTSWFGFKFAGPSKNSPAICEMGGGPDNTGNPASFHGLAQTLVIGNIILPFITIPLTWCFIPNIRLDEQFLDEDDNNEVELQPATEAGLAADPAAPSTAPSTHDSAFGTGLQASFDHARFREAHTLSMTGSRSGMGLL